MIPLLQCATRRKYFRSWVRAISALEGETRRSQRANVYIDGRVPEGSVVLDSDMVGGERCVGAQVAGFVRASRSGRRLPAFFVPTTRGLCQQQLRLTMKKTLRSSRRRLEAAMTTHFEEVQSTHDTYQKGKRGFGVVTERTVDFTPAPKRRKDEQPATRAPNFWSESQPEASSSGHAPPSTTSVGAPPSDDSSGGPSPHTHVHPDHHPSLFPETPAERETEEKPASPPREKKPKV